MSNELSAEKAASLAERCRGKPDKSLGFFGRRAWSRLSKAALSGDASAWDAVSGIALDSEHGCSALAKHVVADQWFRTREPRLLDVVMRSRAVAADGLPRLGTAAVTGQLDAVWLPPDAAALLALCDDAEARVSGPVLDALLRCAANGDDERCPAAKDAVGRRWMSTRDPQLRQAVIDEQAVADEGYARLVTAALCGLLPDVWYHVKEEEVRALLEDSDPLVATNVRATIQATTGYRLADLWDIGVRWATEAYGENGGSPWWQQPFVALLLTAQGAPQQAILDNLWTGWLLQPDPPLEAALRRWALTTSVTALDADAASLIMSGLATPQRAPRVKGLFNLCARLDHPVSADALKHLVQSGPDLVDQFCDLAITNEAARAACIQAKLAPKDATRRVVFFLLTNQIDQYRAFDIDGSLLSLAYAAGTEEDRSRLQEAMRRTGGLDLVRVLVGADRKARIQTMTREEIDYLAGTLASRNEWRRLWSIILDLPLTTAAGLMRHFEHAPWMPDDEDERELFTTFKHTPSATVDSAISQILSSWPMGMHQARIHFIGRINDISFAPDAMTLAVAGTQQVAGLIDLTAGRLTHRFEGFSSSVGRVLHLGGGTFVAAERTNSRFNTCRIHVCSATGNRNRGSQSPVASVVGSVTSLASRGDRGFVAGTRSGSVLLFDSIGERPREVSVATLGLDPESDWPREVTSSDTSGAIAILGRQLVMTNETVTAIQASGYSAKVVQRAIFTPDDGLAVGSGQGTVTVLRKQGRNLTPTFYRDLQGLGGLAAIPSRGQIVAADRSGGDVHFYSPTNLDYVGVISNQRWGTATSLHVSGSGDLLAVGYSDGFTDIYDLRVSAVPAMISKPMVNMVPADIARLDVGLRAQLTGHVAATLSLLRSSLLHRFRFDIELVDAGVLKTGDYDISLA